MEISFEQRLEILKDFTILQLSRVADMAEGGSKDEARDWVRWFENSRVLELLADSEHGVMGACERNRQLKKLAKIRTECHPVDAHDYRSDLAAIRGELAKISEHLGLEKAADHSLSEDEKIINFPGMKI